MSDDEAAVAAPRKTQDPLFDHSGLSVERLPGLTPVFDRMIASLVRDLTPLCQSAPTIAVEAVVSGTLFAILTQRQGLATAVLHSEALDAHALAIFDHRFVDMLIAAVFGGGRIDGARDRAAIPERARTSIENSLLKRVAVAAARALQDGFEGVADAPFALERMETLADTQILGRRDMPIVAAHVAIEAPGFSAAMLVILPHALLLPMRQKLAFDPESEPPAVDRRWAKQLEVGVALARLPVQGVVEEFEMSLGEVADLQVGRVLTLRGVGMGRVRLECGGHDMFWCKLGQTDGVYTLEVEGPIEQEKSLIDELMSA